VGEAPVLEASFLQVHLYQPVLSVLVITYFRSEICSISSSAEVKFNELPVPVEDV
jgi:hypothetical protein